MKNVKEQKEIIIYNKQIEEAVLISKTLEGNAGKIIKRDLLLLEKKFRFQDILGIKDDSVKDQKGIVIGIQQVQNYFDDIEVLATKPRKDPVTGEPEEMNKKENNN